MTPLSQREVNATPAMGRGVKYFAFFCGGITAIVVGTVLVIDMRTDRWEGREGIHLEERLAQAAELEKSDELGAFNIYDAIVQEASKHDTRLSATREWVEEAKRRRDDVAAKAEKAAWRQDEEKKRKEAERVAAIERERQEKERQAREQREQQERAKLAQERRERIKKEAAKYRNASPQAKAALNALKRIAARTEVGVSYVNYGQVVGEQYAEIKIFIESPEAQMMPLFSSRVMAAVEQYKSAMDIWRLKGQLFLFGEEDEEIQIQKAWSKASKEIKKAEEVLLDPEKELELTEK